MFEKGNRTLEFVDVGNIRDNQRSCNVYMASWIEGTLYASSLCYDFIEGFSVPNPICIPLILFEGCKVHVILLLDLLHCPKISIHSPRTWRHTGKGAKIIILVICHWLYSVGYVD